MNRRALAARLVLGPAVIAAASFFFDGGRPFTEVWKPILLYWALALPVGFLLDKLKAKAPA